MKGQQFILFKQKYTVINWHNVCKLWQYNSSKKQRIVTLLVTLQIIYIVGEKGISPCKTLDMDLILSSLEARNDSSPYVCSKYPFL